MPTHGGRRKGSGRKKLPDGVKRTQMNIKVNAEEREAVKRLLKEMRVKTEWSVSTRKGAFLLLKNFKIIFEKGIDKSILWWYT